MSAERILYFWTHELYVIVVFISLKALMKLLTPPLNDLQIIYKFQQTKYFTPWFLYLNYQEVKWAWVSVGSGVLVRLLYTNSSSFQERKKKEGKKKNGYCYFSFRFNYVVASLDLVKVCCVTTAD